MSSIRLFLTISIISAVMLANFLAALHGYQESMREAELLFDQKLEDYAEFIATHSAGTHELKSKHTESQKTTANGVLFQVRDSQGKVISQSLGFPASYEFDKEPSELYINFDRARWRALTFFFPSEARWVVVLENQEIRYRLAESVILKSVYPILLVVPTIAVLVLLIIYLGLRPIGLLTKQVALKRPGELSSISLENSPEELSSLTTTVNELLNRLDDALSREIRFASDAAHELRNPIAALNLQMKNLEDDLVDNTTTNKKSIKALSNGVKRMSHLVEQILILNRSAPELFKANLTKINIIATIQSVIVEVYPMLEASRHEIELNIPPSCSKLFVLGESFSLETLFKNLLVNAIKYTQEVGHISISVAKTKQSVVVKVMDSGIGIPKGERNRIFDRFYRIDGDRNQSNIVGCGLGLAIVKQIAELHDAQVSLKSSNFKTLSGIHIERGLTVELHFPLT